MGGLIKGLKEIYYWRKLDQASKIFSSPSGAYSKEKSRLSPKRKYDYITKIARLKNLDYVETYEFRNKVSRIMNQKWNEYWENNPLEQKV